jgi:hypothetical protein
VVSQRIASETAGNSGSPTKDVPPLPPPPPPPAASPTARCLLRLAVPFLPPLRAAYVIMLAGANSISSSAVGLVYLAAVGPSLVCKATAPYWFHTVSYTRRMHVAALLMACSYTTGRPLCVPLHLSNCPPVAVCPLQP